MGDRGLGIVSCPIFCSIFTLAGRVLLLLLKFCVSVDIAVFLFLFTSWQLPQTDLHNKLKTEKYHHWNSRWTKAVRVKHTESGWTLHVNRHKKCFVLNDVSSDIALKLRACNKEQYSEKCFFFSRKNSYKSGLCCFSCIMFFLNFFF